MMFVDQLFLASYPAFLLPSIKFVDRKDRRILSSLHKQLQQGVFFTENQGKLLIKILKENIAAIESDFPESKTILDHGAWSQRFRVIEKTRRIFLDLKKSDIFFIEFNFDKKLKEKMNLLNNVLEGSVIAVGKIYTIDFTEKNLFTVVKTFKNDDFEIDEKLVNFFKEIEKIYQNFKNPFDVYSMENDKMKKIIEDDVGEISLDNVVLLHDRKFRYQYQISEKISEKSLSAKIAGREKTKVFISRKTYHLDEIFLALKNLKRFPLLVIFDGHDVEHDYKVLNDLINSSKTMSDIDSIGIYFRFNTDVDLLGFNKTISENGLNDKLSKDTKIAGLSNSKLPKFMLGVNWRPNTVLSFTNNYKNNKISTCYNDVDLVIYYNDKQPLNGGIDAIL